MEGSFDLRRQIRKQVKLIRRALPAFERGSVEALHNVRIASRRLRELLPLLDVPSDDMQRIDRRLRRATKRLGAVRELDVLALTIADLLQDSRYPVQPLGRISGDVALARGDARDRLAAKLPAAKLHRLVGVLKRTTRAAAIPASRGRTQRPRRAVHWAIDARIARRAADLIMTIDTAGTLYATVPLHNVRIAIKKLRYAVELAGGSKSRTPIAAATELLKAAQDVLGRLHDLEVLAAWVRQAHASVTPLRLTGIRDLALVLQLVDADCRREHARFLRARASLYVVARRLAGAHRAGIPAAKTRRLA